MRIRHHAIGLNYIDVYQRSGIYTLPMPLVLGNEGAGVIEAVGEGVDAPEAGRPRGLLRRLAGRLRAGAGDVGARRSCRLPDAISFETGAAMMLKGLTAEYLFKRTRPQEGLEPGDFIVFHAAAGGVGLIACQWARALGLKLIGTAGSDEKCALARDNGAAFTINYRTEDFAARVKEITGGKGVKVVYDSVGKDTWEKSLDCLRPFGLMVCFGNASGVVPPFAPVDARRRRARSTSPGRRSFTHMATRESTQAMADDLFAVVESGPGEDPHRPALRARRRGPGASRPRGAQDHRLEHPDSLRHAPCRSEPSLQEPRCSSSTAPRDPDRPPPKSRSTSPASTTARSTPRRGSESPGLEELKRVNPLAQIPTLVLDDGSVLTEVAAILIHLGLDASAERPRSPPIRRGARSRSAAWSTSPPTATPASASSTIPIAGIPIPTTP